MEGQIVKISSDLYFVNYEDEVFPCKCRGLFRKEHITPVVGDYVLFSKDKKLIEEVKPRKNVFDRPKVSNIDQAFLITSLKLPDFSLNLLDKFITLMEIHHVKPIICITKGDLLGKEELEKIKNILSYYEKIGYVVLYNTDLNIIKEYMKNKTSVFTGQTGAGKSTLLNHLNPSWNLETGEVSEALGRGRHTTRVVELFDFLGGKVMDTPGFSSLELNEYSTEQIKNAFREFALYPCPFQDCSHTKEAECCVKKAVLENNILESRYLNYLNFIGVDNREKISVSFLSSKKVPLDLKKLDVTDTDYIHVDIMDGKFVRRKTMPFREMKHIYKYTSKRLDVHLMVEKPSKFIPLYAELNSEYITFHVESEEDIIKNLELIKSYSIKCGLAISPDTPVKELVPYLPYLDMILVMSVVPGEGGQEFIKETEKKLKEVRDLIKTYSVDIIVNVDGGINHETKKYCKEADILTAGSYVVCSDNFQEKITSLR